MAQAIETNLIDAVRDRLASGKRVRRFLPGRGRLHIDRPLPFLVAYRRPVDRPDSGTEQLVVAEGSHLIAPGDAKFQGTLGELVAAVIESLAEQFNAFILLEVWSGDPSEAARPTFRVCVGADTAPRPTLAALIRALRHVRVGRRRAVVEVHTGRHAPRDLPSLLTLDQAKRHSCLMLGLEVPPVYRDATTGEVYPAVLHRFRREVSLAIRRAIFAFARVQTKATVEHFQALGRRAVGRAVAEVDAQLAEIADAFQFLLAVTPVNARDAFTEFEASQFHREPALHYRLLTIDPSLLKRRLYSIPLERVEDPALRELFHEKQVELDRQITMLADRETRNFFHGSMQLYGGVNDELLGLADRILESTGRRARSAAAATDRTTADAATFARRAREEIEYYGRTDGAGVQLRDDVPGLLVSGGTLHVSRDLCVASNRVEPLIAHEVGTHLLTYLNGREQRLQLLRLGVAGYEELQEGIAVLSEWLAGGLTRGRARLLAGRVVAVRRRCEAKSFLDVFHELRDRYGFSTAGAFNVVLRVFRGGGFTKDAIYLRGLASLLAHLAKADANDLDELLVGKISLEALPVVRELRWRGVITGPLVLPRHLQAPAAQHRLDRLRAGLSVVELFDGGDA
jgi:uncharacterized protein (TIGR02421 family)